MQIDNSIDYVGILTTLAAIIAATTALIKASHAAGQSAFDDLEDVVKILKLDVQELKAERIELKAQIHILNVENKDLKERVKTLEDLNSSKDDRILQLKGDYERLQDWASRLVDQLRGAQMDPVKIKTGPLVHPRSK